MNDTVGSGIGVWPYDSPEPPPTVTCVRSLYVVWCRAPDGFWVAVNSRRTPAPRYSWAQLTRRVRLREVTMNDETTTAEVHLITTWLAQPNWTSAHEVRPNGAWTLCGREVAHDLLTRAPEGMRHCGQCERRRL